MPSSIVSSRLALASLMSIASLTTLSTACDGGREVEEEEVEPVALFAVQGQVTNALAVEDASDDELQAYLFWLGTTVAIDRAGVSGEVTSFQLAVYEEPTDGEFNADYPDLALAAIVVMTPATAEEFMLQISGGSSEPLPAGSVFGMSDHWVLFSRTQAAADELALPGLAQGFNLVGPDQEVLACQSEAYAAYDACYLEQSSTCDALLTGNETEDADYEAYDACMSGSGSCEQHFEIADACGSAMQAKALDTQLDIALQIVPDYSEEELVDEEL